MVIHKFGCVGGHLTNRACLLSIPIRKGRWWSQLLENNVRRATTRLVFRKGRAPAGPARYRYLGMDHPWSGSFSPRTQSGVLSFSPCHHLLPCQLGPSLNHLFLAPLWSGQPRRTRQLSSVVPAETPASPRWGRLGPLFIDPVGSNEPLAWKVHFTLITGALKNPIK